MSKSRIFSEKDDSWVEKTWRENASQIYKLCLAWSGNRESANDLFQEVALRFCKYGRSLECDTPLGAWFGTVIRNAHYDMHRRVEKMLPISWLRETSSTYEVFPEQAAVHYRDAYREFMAKDELQYLMECLNPSERLIVELTFFGGISLSKAAKMLGSTKNSVYRRRCDAIAKMQRQKIIRDERLQKRDAPTVLLGDLLTRKIEIS